jgi:hypothetical protein
MFDLRLERIAEGARRNGYAQALIDVFDLLFNDEGLSKTSKARLLEELRGLMLKKKALELPEAVPPPPRDRDPDT